MKKTLLAAALTVGFAGVAQAETSVTLYGIVDTGIGYERVKAGDAKLTKTGIRSGVQSGNRWGLKGVEDLGNGLRAVFQLESGFDLGTGYHQQNNRLFGRQATLGLASDAWGQLDFGRQTNVASKYLPGIIDPFGAGFGQANAGASFGAADTVRYDNMVMYQTPNFSGFQFGIGYSFNTDGAEDYKIKGVTGIDDSNPNDRAITTGLRYANGPIGVALTYDQRKSNTNAGFQDTTAKQWNLGAAYDFEVVKVSAAFGQTRNGSFTNQFTYGTFYNGIIDSELDGRVARYDRGFKANSYLVGLTAPIGAGSVLASWQMSDPRSNPDRDSAWDMKKQHVYSLGYTYGLSKRTNVYAYGSYAKNFNYNNDAKSTVAGVGLRHQF